MSVFLWFPLPSGGGIFLCVYLLTIYEAADKLTQTKSAKMSYWYTNHLPKYAKQSVLCRI